VHAAIARDRRAGGRLIRHPRSLLLVAAAAVLVSGGVATAKTLGFATVAQAQRPVGLDEPGYPRTQRVGEFLGYVVTDATHMTFYATDFRAQDQRRFDAVNWDRKLLFLAVLKARTSGYRVTIRRVVLQRISRSARQFCVIASVERPRAGVPVVVRPYFAAHAVALSSARFRLDQFHYAIPTRFVVRGTNGELLTVSKFGDSRGVGKQSGRPELCRLASRASDEPLG